MGCPASRSSIARLIRFGFGAVEVCASSDADITTAMLSNPAICFMCFISLGSEQIFESELHLAHRPRRGNFTKGRGVARVRAWRVPVRMVCRVERFPSKLQRVPFAQANIASERSIEHSSSRLEQHIAARVAGEI